MRSVNEFLRYIGPLFWPSEESFHSLRELTCAISFNSFGPSLLKNANLHFSSLYGGSGAKIFPEGYHSIVMSFDLEVANEDMRCCGVEHGRG